MRLKLTIMLLVLIIAYAWMREADSDVQKLQVKTQAPKTLVPPRKQHEKKNIKIKEDKQQLEQQKKEKLEDDFYHELSAQRYSKEPVVEMISLAWELEKCNKYKYYDTRKNYYKNFVLKQKQKHMFEAFDTGCQNFKKNYPVLSQSMEKLDAKLLFISLAASSPYADLVQRGMNYKKMTPVEQREFNDEMAIALLKSNNAQLLLVFVKISSEETFFRGLLELEEVLRSANSVYIQMIAEQAAMLLSCQFNAGISCKAESSVYMLQQCIAEEAACGLDVETWFKMQFTAAHYRDVELMLTYFKSL